MSAGQPNVVEYNLEQDQRQIDRAGDRFVRSYYGVWPSWDWVKWFGVPMIKFPTDLWSYQEIITETKPDLIIETGTFMGGSAYFFATILALLGNGRIVTIDVNYSPDFPRHRCLTYLTGSSVDSEIVAQVHELARAKRVMVVLDSDHSCEHVLRELDCYGPLVSKGCYLVVEDTNINGRPVLPEYGSGPGEALDEWLPAHPDFVHDPARVKFGITANPGGWLRRK